MSSVSGKLPVTIALAKAKTWLREEATWGEITRLYQQCWDNAEDDSQGSIIKKALNRSKKQNPNEIPFQDAYYWSGVVISGSGNFYHKDTKDTKIFPTPYSLVGGQGLDLCI
jgi:CHAT domain-containing protein